MMSDLAGKPEALLQTIIGNCTTTIPIKFDRHDGEVANTVAFGPTGKGMSAISDAMIEEYKRRGATTAVVDKGPSLHKREMVSEAVEIAVQTALVEKIQRQDRFIAELQAELQRARKASVDTMLGHLRLRQAVLLYVGHDADNFALQIAENFGGDVAMAVLSSLFVLDNAPAPPEAREAIRKATNHGMDRW